MLVVNLLSSINLCIIHDASLNYWVEYATLSRLRSRQCIRILPDPGSEFASTPSTTRPRVDHFFPSSPRILYNIVFRSLSHWNESTTRCGNCMIARADRVCEPVSSFADSIAPHCLLFTEGNTTLNRFCRLANQEP